MSQAPSPYRFSADELRRIQRTIATRLDLTGRRDLLDIGFGPGMRGGQLDPQRPWCICVYVPRKLPRPVRPVPDQLTFRLKRGDHFHRFTAPTDVVAAGRSRLSGLPVAGGSAVAGAVVVWKNRRAATRTWALLTVGHAFRELSLPAEITVGSGSLAAFGTLVARSTSTGVDAALVVVDRFELVRTQLLPPVPGTRRMGVRTIDQLIASVGWDGLTRPDEVGLPFQVRAYLPRSRMFESQVGILRHVVHVHRAPQGTFAQGTSGSLWTIRQVASALQFGGLAPQFQEGFGQALQEILQWAQQAASDLEQIQPNSFQIVAGL